MAHPERIRTVGAQEVRESGKGTTLGDRNHTGRYEANFRIKLKKETAWLATLALLFLLSSFSLSLSLSNLLPR